VKTYRYTVTGNTQFPVDMLRYDACYPVSSEGASTITMSFRRFPEDAKGPFTVELVGLHPPTDARWRSFAWTVVNPSTVRR